MKSYVKSKISKFGIILADKGRRSNAIKEYELLMKSQYWKTDKLHKLQMDKLFVLLDQARRYVPYYQNVFKTNNIQLNRTETMIILKQLPVINKEIIRHNKKAINSTNPVVKRCALPRSTGGSTGEPLQFLMSSEARSSMWGNIWRQWSVNGYVLGDKVGIIAGDSILRGFDWKKQLYRRLNNWITLNAFNIDELVAKDFMETLEKKQVKYLYGYANALLALADYAVKFEMKANIKAVFSTAEQLLPAARQKIQQAFQCSVYNTYGANDGGISAFECERHNGLHVGMERCFVEILRDDGSEASEYEVGRIVLTDLDNHSFPFIRYEVGDLGSLTYQPCACGRGLIRLIELAGRLSEMIIMPSGAIVHGEIFSHVFRKSNLVQRFQVIQHTRDNVEVRINPFISAEPSDINYISNQLRRLLPGMHIEIIITDNFLHTLGGKHRVVVPL